MDYSKNSDTGEYIWREKRTEEKWQLRRYNYIDWSPDTLYFSDGRHYFIRRSPLSLKSGYSNVFSKEEVDLEHVIVFDGPPNYNNGRKGYTLAWLLRNDSLFIKDINLDYTVTLLKDDEGKHIIDDKGNYATKRNIDLPRDTIIARLEKFTGSKFVNGLMFVDWITGDFGIITDYHQKPKVIEQRDKMLYAIMNGFIVKFKDGLFVKMKKDKRKNKH